MRKGKVLLVMLAVLAMAGVAAAQCTPADPPGGETPEYVPCDGNLIVNGDFEQTDGTLLGFASDYTPYFGRNPGDVDFTVPGECYQDQGNCGNDYENPSMWCPGVWVIGWNPANYHVLWYTTQFNGAGVGNFGDHTTNGGNMFILNGSTTAAVVLWRQAVTVTPFTDYSFSYWARSVYTSAMPILTVKANGTELTAVSDDDVEPGQWKKISYLWNSGSSTEAAIEISNLVSAFGGNDYAIDDIEMCPLGPPPCESELIAGQYDNVGQVVVTDDCDGVKVKLTANEGYAFSEIHVGAGCVGDDNIPVNRKGNPQIGQFYFSEEYPDVWLDYKEVTIPLDVALPCEGETDIDVAVHAVVKYTYLDPTCQQPTVMLHATKNSLPTADIYRIFPTVPAEVFITSQTEPVNLQTANFNGNAFDGKHFYFSRFDWDGSFNPLASKLFFNDLEGNFGFAGEITGASGGTVHGGYYYYFMERTDDLYRLPLVGDGTVGPAELVNDNVLDDAVYPGGRLAFGDIAIRSDGKMFGSATRLPATGSSGPGVFFSMNIDGTGYTELPYGGGDIGAGGIQIAFGADGVLYGVNARPNLQLISIDLTEENLGDVTVISTLARSYSDLASGGYCDVPDETAWGNGCYPDTGIQFSNDSGWAMYFKYFVNTDPLACIPE